MHNREAYIRYRLIDERLRKKPCPSLEQLQQYISDRAGRSVTTRTLQNDIQDMRIHQGLNFNAPIIFDKREKGYRYSDDSYSISNMPVSADDLRGISFAITFLDQFKHLAVIKEFEEAMMKIAAAVELNKETDSEPTHVYTDWAFPVRGSDFAVDIRNAIEAKRLIEFNYQGFDKKEGGKRILAPYMMRIFKDFWYVVGKEQSSKKIKTFALDRMSDLRIAEDEFSDDGFDRKAYFRHILGVTFGDGKVQHIVLSFDPHIGKYIKTRPLHHTQKIIADNKNELHISLDLVINPELKSVILSYGSNVKVLQPHILAKEIEIEGAKIRERYLKSR